MPEPKEPSLEKNSKTEEEKAQLRPRSPSKSKVTNPFSLSSYLTKKAPLVQIQIRFTHQAAQPKKEPSSSKENPPRRAPTPEAAGARLQGDAEGAPQRPGLLGRTVIVSSSSRSRSPPKKPPRGRAAPPQTPHLTPKKMTGATRPQPTPCSRDAKTEAAPFLSPAPGAPPSSQDRRPREPR